jgi:hypothetical protein
MSVPIKERVASTEAMRHLNNVTPLRRDQFLDGRVPVPIVRMDNPGSIRRTNEGSTIYTPLPRAPTAPSCAIL